MKNKKNTVTISEARLKQMVNQVVKEELSFSKEERALRNVIRESVRENLDEIISGQEISDMVSKVDKMLVALRIKAESISEDDKRKLADRAQGIIDNIMSQGELEGEKMAQIKAEYEQKARDAMARHDFANAIIYKIVAQLNTMSTGKFKDSDQFIAGTKKMTRDAVNNGINGVKQIGQEFTDAYNTGDDLGSSMKAGGKVLGRYLNEGIKSLLNTLFPGTPQAKNSPAAAKVQSFRGKALSDKEVCDAFDRSVEEIGMEGTIEAIKPQIQALTVDSTYNDFRNIIISLAPNDPRPMRMK